MAEGRNYIALEWVIGEIEETLVQARNSLEDYVDDPDDLTKLKFCLTYAHQVNGSVKMLELHGAAILASEIELLCQALVDNAVADASAAEILMTAFIQLSAYLQRVQSTHDDQPASLLNILNELRGLRGQDALTRSEVFNPDVSKASAKEVSSGKANIEIEEFNDLIRKLRQSFQAAMVGVMRDQELDQNYDAIEKVGAHLHQISLHTASEPLWQIFHAVGQILKSDAQAASADTKLLLRNVDGEIKHLQEFGVNAFGSAPSKALLKSLLFTVAEAEAISELVGHIQTEYELKEALKESELSSQLAIPDTEAMRGVMKALNEELQSAQEILDQNARGEVHEGFELVNLVSILSKVVNTLFVLGANEIAELMQEQQDAVVHLIADDLNVQHDALLDVAAKIVLVQDALQSTSVEEAKKINLAGNQLLDAHISVLREARAGLAQAKEAVIEFVASQWNPEKLYGVPELLDQIQGGLAMIPLERAAAITRACKQYLTVDLLGNGQIPDWQVLDSLADAMTSVEYYLECLADDGRSDLESILLVAEQSVATLGYPIELDAASVAPEEETPVDTSKFVGKIDVPEAPAPKSDEHLDDIDEELMEVFIEEADEVLAVIAEFMPKWHEDTQDIAAMTELRRAFHTLKGSGRMVGEKYLSALAWAIESMFNRILDSNIPSTHDHVQLVAQAQALVPELMLAFKERRIPDVANDIVNISAEAEVLGRAESTANTAQSNAIETESEASEATSESIELSAPQAADTEAGQSVVEIPNLGVVDNIEDVDEDVIEIFIEEAEEVLEAIDERLPGLQANFDDAEALADLRRAFHTLKGSGRMVGANVIGETAWAVENMLNRIVEGTHKVNEQTLLIMSTARVVVPPMIEAFKTQSQAANLADAERLAAYADIIAKGETPNFAIVSSADAPVTEPVSEPELVAEEQSLEVDLDETTNIELEAESEDSPSSEIDAVDVAETIEAIDDPYAELDPELISIFLEEARGHMEVYHDFVTEADQESAPILLSESLQRALHTLKGSAHMAGIEPLAERVSPIERLVKEFRACQTPVDSAVLDLMKQGEYLINEGISLLVQKVEILDDGVAEYAQHVISACEQNLANLAHAQSDADNREDIAATVLAAGMERLLHASDLLNAWIANKLSPAQLKEIAEDLSSLSSHAEQAEYKEIQNLAAVLGELYARVDAKALAQQDAFYEIAQRSHETLIDMMDMLAAGQNLIAADQLIAELSAMPVAEIEAVAEQTDSELVAEQDDFENLLLMLRASLADADEETLEIFNEEANELIDVVDDAAAAWAAEPENAAARDNLLRPLHTLKGGARLSGLKELGDYTHEFETLIESQLTPNAELFAQIKVYVEGTHRMIECVQAVDAQPNDSSVSNIQSLADIEDVEAEAEAEALAAVDPEVLEIFMEEANDQLEQIESSIITWKDDRKNTAVQDKLKRVLHTLKGGARLSGIVGVGDLSHEFESYIIERDAKLDFDDEFFAQLDTYQGQLHQEIDRIAKGEAVKVESTGVITSMADLPEFANKEISQAAVNATQNFISSFEQEQSQSRGPQEVVKVSAELLANLVNLAGETSISRSRLEEQISEQSFAIEEMDITLDRMAGQLRRLEIETEAQIVFRMEQVESEGMENFDPLEMDRYSQLQQLSRSK